jgi:hypothetical protein
MKKTRSLRSDGFCVEAHFASRTRTRSSLFNVEDNAPQSIAMPGLKLAGEKEAAEG